MAWPITDKFVITEADEALTAAYTEWRFPLPVKRAVLINRDKPTSGNVISVAVKIDGVATEIARLDGLEKMNYITPRKEFIEQIWVKYLTGAPSFKGAAYFK